MCAKKVRKKPNNYAFDNTFSGGTVTVVLVAWCRYMAATQHWLKTDIVNGEELRMIRAQVFGAIQRKRSELHREASAVLRAERCGEACTVSL